MTTRILLLAALCLAAFATARASEDAEQAMLLDARLVLRLTDRDAARHGLVARAEALDGWFSELTDERLVLRVPREAFDTLVAAAAESGTVLERSLSRRDRASEVGDLQALLSARQEVLERYLELLAAAPPHSLLDVEVEVTRLVAEIEDVTGDLRVLRAATDFGTVRVDFRFPARQRVTHERSSWRWIDDLSLPRFVDALQRGAWRARPHAKGVAPAGFAAWGDKKRFQAVSADGVAYRLWSHEITKGVDLAFWAEAAEHHLDTSGYRVIRSEPITTAGGTGHLLELVMPMPDEDLSWLIAILPQRKRMLIAEAQGAASAFERQRAAVVAAIEQVDW